MKAIICGGSVGGLFCAAALMRAGWEVVVFERSAVELSGRGAGIVTHPALLKALESVGAGTDDLGVAATDRVAIDRAGGTIKTIAHSQIFTAWDRVYSLLRALIPPGAYRLDSALASYRDNGASVVVRFEDGSEETADLLVGADGFRSAVRAQMFPDVQPRYADYVVWRAVAEEAALSTEFRERLFETFGIYAPSGRQILGYPIAGAHNDLRPNHRRYNFVWYRAYDADELAAMLIDANGEAHDVSIPPPLIREDVVATMEEEARQRVPSVFLDALDAADRPFFTPIYDLISPQFAQGRVALCGDAACTARPHVGMGVTKAADDALCLARSVAAGNIPEGLTAYSAERLPVARFVYDRAQRLGRYIFSEESGGAANTDGRGHPHLDEVVRFTGVDCSADAVKQVAAAPT